MESNSPAQAQLETKRFATLPSGLALLIEWLLSHRITAACMEATGIYWITVYDELCAASFEVHVYNAQHVKQFKGRKTNLEDSRWLAQICQFGLGCPSLSDPVKKVPLLTHAQPPSAS